MRDIQLQLHFCRACGHAEWHVPDGAPFDVAEGPPCPWCRKRKSAPATPVMERVGRRGQAVLGGKAMPLAARICGGCRKIAWSTSRPPASRAAGRDRCLGCGQGAVEITVDDRITRFRKKPLALAPGHDFHLRVCGACARVDWRVTEPRTVPVGTTVQPAPPSGGAYRESAAAGSRAWIPDEAPRPIVLSRPLGSRPPEPCGKHDFEHITAVPDHDLAEVPASLSIGGEPLHLRACRVCEHVQWHVEDPDRIDVGPRVKRVRTRCPTCRGRRMLDIRPVSERVGQGEEWALGVDHFPLRARICLSCGEVHWRASDHWIDLAPGQDVCRTCGKQGVVTKAVADYRSRTFGDTLATAGGNPLRVHLCNHCAHVEWSLVSRPPGS